MIPPCPTKSYPGVWEVPMVMWQDLKGGRCSMADACSNPPDAEGVYQMLAKNFERHYNSNRAPFGMYYHAAWFTQAHHKEGKNTLYTLNYCQTGKPGLINCFFFRLRAILRCPCTNG